MTEASYAGSLVQVRQQQKCKTDELWPMFLKATWRNLVMLNFEIDPQRLLSRVPQGTELDLYRGKAYVSVIGFQFHNTRLFGFPIPLHQNFPEVNLRFYVRRYANGELRRGVVFIKEIVPRRAVAYVARTIYHENYIRLPMREKIQIVAEGSSQRHTYDYRWQFNGVWENMHGSTTARFALPVHASQQQFIVEHYWGYSAQPDGSCLEYRVDHPKWQVADADAILCCDVASLYGQDFVEALSAPPDSAFLVDGSGVTVSRGRRLTKK